MQWLLSFINDRGLRVAMSGMESSESRLNLGVPQGSILGPLIFLLFINDLPSFFGDVHVIMYADDTSIVVDADTPENLEVKVRNVAERFDRWCKENRIILNMQKTVYMNFNIRRPLPVNVLTGVLLSDKTSFLGIHIDKNRDASTKPKGQARTHNTPGPSSGNVPTPTNPQTAPTPQRNDSIISESIFGIDVSVTEIAPRQEFNASYNRSTDVSVETYRSLRPDEKMLDRLIVKEEMEYYATTLLWIRLIESRSKKVAQYLPPKRQRFIKRLATNI